MVWYATGFALLLHTLFWGAGLTYFITPRRWLPFWWVFCPMAGLGLKSAVVWAGAHTGLAGTHIYGLPSLLLPAGLLVAAVVRLGRRRSAALFLATGRAWGLGVIMLFCLTLQIYPMARLDPQLTSMSLGSCDAADYAAGARVFQDFSSHDRSGFLGLGKVNEVPGIDSFPVFWLRLNHFTPSALIALDGTVFHSRPHKLASLTGAVLAVLALPGVFWLARSGFRLSAAASGFITLLYGCSPVVSYAVYHCALAQLIAAPAVALLTWTGLQTFRGPVTLRRFGRYAPLLLLANWLILGAYNFFILFSYVPLLGFVALATLRRRRWADALRWSAFTLTTVLLAGLLFPGRVVALIARLSLINKIGYGWPIPAFGPTGWFGIFASSKLEPAIGLLPSAGAAACLLALIFALYQLLRRRRWAVVFLAISSTAPILAGYALLIWQDQHRSDNSSYNAYKIFAVFLPGLLASFCLWADPLGWRSDHSRVRMFATALLAFAVLSGNLAMLPRFAAELKHQGLIVDRQMVQLAKVEQMADIHSLNICLEPYWSRLWANYFLLRKPHYFRQDTYEGRVTGEPLGDWDLRENFFVIEPVSPSERREINSGYYLVDRRSATFVDLKIGTGWSSVDFHDFGPFALGAGSPQTVEMNNSHPYPLRTATQFTAMSSGPRALRVRAGASVVWEGAIGTTQQTTDEFPVELPPGRTLLEFETPPAPGERQAYTVALHQLKVRVLEPANRAAPAAGDR